MEGEPLTLVRAMLAGDDTMPESALPTKAQSAPAASSSITTSRWPLKQATHTAVQPDVSSAFTFRSAARLVSIQLTIW